MNLFSRIKSFFRKNKEAPQQIWEAPQEFYEAPEEREGNIALTQIREVLRKSQIDLVFHSFFRNFAAYTTKNNRTSATIWRTPAISLQKND